ncbi:2-amino-4-hydroxy-6-hydroxymethyldihydropteridine diphosphokinase [Thalassotalea agarivorans]|uniref:2-amino-4-hydroxy-6-hydroxymethyldihydropteridine pyrophosphokinase n=1 Tax=Thalassotalea agarivorans TaxID=349064 RepID=A0A1I0GMH3_THASX|nr:2-amino-4-hydroxy-6-hydroxymethyldihydropteridine diphosphokinase [Thalassotalea agarivorans]SET72164.1 2-amino-4-hydroxy-6-hydroxymethyldihydropteridinediphosphokinase [Thalassotalea agarivorans]
MNTVFIGLGSNLDDPLNQLKQAIEALKRLPQSTLTGVSSLYGSKPMGPQDQPDYVNAVAQLSTSLEPILLLDSLQAIEQDFGRERIKRWGARTLDLDILLYGQHIIDEPRLVVPHYGLTEREFVLIPLAEISPELTLPNGQSIQALAETIDRNGLERLCTI